MGTTNDQQSCAPAWTYADASCFLDSTAKHLKAVGLVGKIVGSVVTQGFSHKDLDILLEPQAPMGMTEALEAIKSHLLPVLSNDLDINPIETFDPVDSWFVNIGLHDGRIVEFFLPERSFPLELD